MCGFGVEVLRENEKFVLERRDWVIAAYFKVRCEADTATRSTLKLGHMAQLPFLMSF